MKKIGITGAHGTGKTMLSYQLAADMKSTNPDQTILITESVTRNCPFFLNTYSSREAIQKWIFCRTLLQEIEKENQKPDVLICERTLLDNLAYAEYYEPDNLWTDNFFKIAIEHMKTYDILYFLRPKFPISADGVRSPDIKFQMAIDKTLNEWIETFGIRYKNPIQYVRDGV